MKRKIKNSGALEQLIGKRTIIEIDKKNSSDDDVETLSCTIEGFDDSHLHVKGAYQLSSDECEGSPIDVVMQYTGEEDDDGEKVSPKLIALRREFIRTIFNPSRQKQYLELHKKTSGRRNETYEDVKGINYPSKDNDGFEEIKICKYSAHIFRRKDITRILSEDILKGK